MKRDYDWDWSGAEEEFQRAIDLNPGCAEAYHWRGTMFGMLGRHAEAVSDKTKALSMDPLSVIFRHDVGRMEYFARDYDRALEHYRAALDMDARFFFSHLGLAQVYLLKGLFKPAISALKAGVRLTNNSTFALARLTHGHAVARESKKARAMLKRLRATSGQRYVSPFDIALVHVGLEDYDEAFVSLQRALEDRSPWLGYLQVDPQFDPVRADPRFQDLLSRIGLA